MEPSKLDAIVKAAKFRTSRSSGSGGQHVNKVSTRVELILDIEAKELLTEAEKNRIKKVLKTRINQAGQLSVVVDNSRSQLLNRKAATRKLKKLIKLALTPPKKRKGPPKLKSNPEARLKAKKRKAEIKSFRKKVDRRMAHPD